MDKNTNPFDEFSKKFAEMMPDRMREISEDMRKNFNTLAQATFAKMDLVTREELEVQNKVLEKNREMLLQLEARVNQLEQKVLEVAKSGSTE